MSEDLRSSVSSATSSTVDHSSSSYNSSVGRREESRKRKRHASHDSESQLSSLKRFYNTKYHGLLNDAISGLDTDPLIPHRDNAPTAQAGMCFWSSQERELLFRGIARHGQDKLPAIAALIGTKSEPEVHVYIQSLKAASKKQHMYGKRQSLVGLGDIPAAVEISDDCCVSLELAADSLAIMQQRHEEHFEKQRHISLWKLDQDKAQWVEQRLRESEEGRSEIHEKLPAAELLNLEEMLKLSRNFFMNAADLDMDWRSFCTKGETPALLYTAFSDLHDIALSITSRLIQTALFFAMSRLRAAKSPYYTLQRTVKRCDVSAALKVLGMKESASDGWVQIARRCKLEVYDQARASSQKYNLDYNQVERILRGEELRARSRSKQGDGTCDDNDSSAEPTSEDKSGSPSGSSDSSSHSSSQSSMTPDRNEPADKFGKRTDAYLESIDQQASKKEETRLWKMLGKNPPSSLLSEEPTEIENPGPHRHDREDLDDWRDWVDFKSEWEVYDVQHPGASLKNDGDQAQLEGKMLLKLAKSGNQRRQVRPEQSFESDSPSASDQQSASHLDSDPEAVHSSTNDASSESEEVLEHTDSEG
ncbi:MAG: hypothetical protein Q9178_004251 [Gyalolechia marmorata]